jgi:hypothetical protein
MTGIDKLKAGDFNCMELEELANGSCLVTLKKRGASSMYRLVVRDLYGPDEELISEEEIEVE